MCFWARIATNSIQSVTGSCVLVTRAVYFFLIECPIWRFWSVLVGLSTPENVWYGLSTPFGESVKPGFAILFA